MIVNDIFLDFNKLNKHLINSSKMTDRLQKAYQAVGGTFYDDEKQIMKGPLVFITGIGGILIENRKDGSYLLNKKIDSESLQDIVMKMAGVSSFMSYLNPGNLELAELGDKVLNEYQHSSVLHPISLNIVIIGHSIGVEHEIASQRDLVHLSRLTVAKTTTQSSPCLTLLNSDLVNTYKTALSQINSLVKSESSQDKESLNLLFPTAKSSLIMLSGSMKNFLKIIDMRNDSGKEDEFVYLLEKMSDVLDSALS